MLHFPRLSFEPPNNNVIFVGTCILVMNLKILSPFDCKFPLEMVSFDKQPMVRKLFYLIFTLRKVSYFTSLDEHIFRLLG